MNNDRRAARQDLSSDQNRQVSLIHFDSATLDPAWRYEAWRENVGVLFDVSPQVSPVRRKMMGRASNRSIDWRDTCGPQSCSRRPSMTLRG